MPGIEIATAGGVIVACLGVILTWLKTSREQGDRDGRIETEIRGIDKKLDSLVEHHEEVAQALQSQAKFCSGFTSRLDQRVINLEKEVFNR